MKYKNNIWKPIENLMKISAIVLTILYLLTFQTIKAEETENEPSSTNQQETQETQEYEKDDKSNEEEISIQLKDISEKVEAVGNEISLQKVDSQKIEDQAEELKAVKESIESIKAQLATASPNGPIYTPYMKNGVTPLDTSKKIYFYRMIVKGFSTESRNGTYIFASNSPNLSLVQSDTVNTYVGLSGLYADNELRIQPTCACKIGSKKVNEGTYWGDETIENEKEALELMSNPDNWGWPVNLASNYSLCSMREHPGGNSKYITEQMIIPMGPSEESTVEEEPFTTGIGIKDNYSTYYIYFSNIESFEKIEYGPTEKEWETKDLYLPIMIIMSTLLIMLFRRKH